MDVGEELPGIVPANYVGIDKGGNGKGWSGQQEDDEVDICGYCGGSIPGADFG